MLVAPFGRPVNYLSATTDSARFESARMVSLAYDYLANNKVEGDYAEFGVFSGKTTIESYKASRRSGLNNMRFLIFDSFEGLPKPQGIDDNGSFSEGEFACSQDEFIRNLERAKCDLSRFIITKGWFNDTLPTFSGDNKIAFAWIDGDLYESTVDPLEFLTDRIVHGAVIVFDDWFCYHGDPTKGEQRACNEWLAKNPHIKLIEYQNYSWSGKSFIVNLH